MDVVEGSSNLTTSGPESESLSEFDEILLVVRFLGMVLVIISYLYVG